MSSRQQPSSRSSCVKQASAEASGSRTVSSTRTPARFTAVTIFCVAEPHAVTMCTLASRRWPTIPIAWRMLSCASRKNSCGRTCNTSRSSGSCMPRAASTARRTSSRWMSRGRPTTVIPPRLFTPRTCVPATPISADSTGTPTMVSASSTARRIELTARSRFTIWPLRQPFDSAAPKAANFTPPSSPSSPISAQVFVLPMSSATICRSFFVKSAPYNFARLCPLSRLFPRNLVCCMNRFRRGFRWRGRPRSNLLRHRSVRIHDCFPVEAQIHRFYAPCFRAPLSEVIQQGLILCFEIVVAKMHENKRICLLPAGSTFAIQTGDRGAQVTHVRKVHFAYLFHRSGPRGFHLLSESGKELHAPLALVRRHILADAGDHRKMKTRLQRPFKNNAMNIHERQIASLPKKRDGNPLRDFYFDLIGQCSPNGGLRHPRNCFELAPPFSKRNAQNATALIGFKNCEYTAARDVIIPG